MFDVSSMYDKKKNENLRNKETLRGNNWLKKTSDLFGVRMKESLIEI